MSASVIGNDDNFLISFCHVDVTFDLPFAEFVRLSQKHCSGIARGVYAAGLGE
jgi:hypothetical protein